MNTIKILTTQNVEVEYPLASVGDRILAYLIDCAVFFVWIMAVSIAFANGLKSTGGIILMVSMMLPVMLYHPLCEIFFNGQSLGKRARDIKVIKVNGEAPTVGDYLLRWLFRLIDVSISSGVIAVVAVAATDRNQRLGDMAAGTTVIRTQQVRRRDSLPVQSEEGYEVRFPEVTLLTDKDVALIRKLLYKAQQNGNYGLLEKMAERVREVTGITAPELTEWELLNIVIKDYHHATHGDIEV